MPQAKRKAAAGSSKKQAKKRPTGAPLAPVRGPDGSSFAKCPECKGNVLRFSLKAHIGSEACHKAQPKGEGGVGGVIEIPSEDEGGAGEVGAGSVGGHDGSRGAGAAGEAPPTPVKEVGATEQAGAEESVMDGGLAGAGGGGGGDAPPTPWNMMAPRMDKIEGVLRRNQKVQGLIHIHNFISEQEEAELIEQLDDLNRWEETRMAGKWDWQGWGLVTNLVDETVREPMAGTDRAFPAFFQKFWDRWQEQAPAPKDLGGWVPTEANCNSYEKAKGHWLKDHFDHRRLSGAKLVNLSLGGDCYMDFKVIAGQKNPPLGPKEVSVLLPRRSLQIVTGWARYKYTHGISKEGLLNDRRVSITFRRPNLTPM